jgi:transcriptional regulator with XRE-family HTH domain
LIGGWILEFGEKLQILRKGKGLTQEELAENLYVTRTAVSKWESGRGYPSIDSIKEIAALFSVTIDELLSSEKILSLAEKENKQNIQKMCNTLFGVVDLFTLMLVVLPLYPNTVNDYIYSINLFEFTKNASFGIVYWIFFLSLTVIGVLKIILTQLNVTKGEKCVLWCSMGLCVFGVLFLALSRQVYATVIMFVFLIIKGMLYLKYVKR